MVTLQDKLNLFKEIVDSKVQKQIDEAVRLKRQELEEIIAKERFEIERTASRNQKSATERISRGKYEQLSTITQTHKRTYLRQSEELLSRLLQDVRMQLVEFASSADYLPFLAKSFAYALQSLPTPGPLTVSLTPDRFQEQKEVLEPVLAQKNLSQVTFVHGDTLDIGGFIIEDKEQGVRINKTFRAAMALTQEEIGQMFYKYVGKEV